MEPEQSELPLSQGNSEPEGFGTSAADIPELSFKRAMGSLPSFGRDFRLKSTASAEVNATKRQDGSRVVELYVAHFGNVDSHGEVIEKGAFDDSIEARGPKGEDIIPFLWDHEVLLGKSLEVRPDSTGIFQVASIDDARELDRYYEHAKSGAAKRGSIGFLARRGDFRAETREGRKCSVLQRGTMLEGSLVLFPANERAVVVNVRSAARVAAKSASDPKMQKSLYSLARALHIVAEIQTYLREWEDIMSGENWYAPATESDRILFQSILAAMPSLDIGMLARKPEPLAEKPLAEVVEEIAAPIEKSVAVADPDSEEVDSQKKLLKSLDALLALSRESQSTE